MLFRSGEGVIAGAARTEAKVATMRTAAADQGTPRKAPPPFTLDAARLKAGSAVADLALRGPDGAAVRLSEFRGQPLVLSLSPAESIPDDFLERTVARFGADGVKVLAVVTRDTESGYRAWLDLHRGRHRFATAFDPAGPDAIRESAIFLTLGMVTPMPVVLAIDAEGKLLGKVAPKVTSSFQGLAELLRRAGVKVKPDELPSAEQMALVAAFAATSTTAASPAPAATASKADSTADRDFAAFQKLSGTKAPGKPSEMGGMKPYLQWTDAHHLRVTEAGLAFHRAHPSDPRQIGRAHV